MTCCKHRYRSIRSAKRAHRFAHFRIRIYYCATCRSFHVANGDKS